MQNMKRSLAITLALTGLLFFGVQSALALGTAPNTSITNQATLSYSVNSVGQDDILSGQTSFVVDHLVDLTLVNQDGGNVPVTPEATDQVLEFLLTNEGNDVQDFLLTVTQDGGDDFNASSYELYYDSNSSGGWDGADLAVPTSGANRYIDELSDNSGSNTVTIFIVSVIPADAPAPNDLNDGDLANLILQAVAKAGGGAVALGADLTETGSNTSTLADTLFGDPGLDATESDTGTYEISTADLTVTKDDDLFWDPVNEYAGTTYHIPGAYVRYTITITNDAGSSQSATLTTISDPLNGNTTLDANMMNQTDGNPESGANIAFRARVQNTTRSNTNWIYYTVADDDDGIDLETGSVVVNFSQMAGAKELLPAETVGATTWVDDELKAGEYVEIEFNVTIN